MVMIASVKKVFSSKTKSVTEQAVSAGGEAKKSRFGIGLRLMVAFSAVAALTVVISGISWFNLGNLTDAQSNMTQQKVPAISLALKLANDTSRIAAAAPQLSNAASDAARKKSMTELNAAVETAKGRLAELNDFVADDPALKGINSSLQDVTPLLSRLDGLVKERHRLSGLRHKISARMMSLRTILENELDGFLLPLRFGMLENNDAMNELIGIAVETAKTGADPEYDTAPIAQKNRTILDTQGYVLEIKSSGYLMLSLLAEGLQAETLKQVSSLETAFLTTLSLMATPLGELEKQNAGSENMVKLRALFEELLQLGAKGTKDQRVFKIRIAELKAKAEADKNLAKSRTLAATLTKDVNDFVSNIEDKVHQAAKANATLAEQTKMTLLICALAAIIVAVAIGWLYIQRNIIRRLMMLVGSARKLSDGDLTASIYREGSDEIAQMGYALVGFRNTAREAEKTRAEADKQRERREADKARSEQERIEAEKQAQEEKERLAAEAEADKKSQMDKLATDFEGSVKHLVESFGLATQEMTTTSQSMSETANETSSRSATVATASEMASTSVNSVAAATEELSSSITEISRQVGQAATIAGDAVSEAERTNQMVNSLNAAASKIGDVVGLINDIAGQTNLLALNATIEAARAGDAGKGFAVVASEVKSLATQTARATDEISEQIKAVQEETKNAVGAIGGIGTTIGRINEIAASISAAVEQQGAATGEISQSVQRAAEGAEEVTLNIASVNKAAGETGTSASQVQDVAMRLSAEVNDLDTEVERFLVQVRSA